MFNVLQDHALSDFVDGYTGNECLKRKMTNTTIIFQKTKMISKIWIMVKNEGVFPDIIQTINTIAWALGDLWKV